MNGHRITILRKLREAVEEGSEFEAARLLHDALRVGPCDAATLSLQCRQLRPPIRTAPRKPFPAGPPHYA